MACGLACCDSNIMYTTIVVKHQRAELKPIGDDVIMYLPHIEERMIDYLFLGAHCAHISIFSWWSCGMTFDLVLSASQTVRDQPRSDGNYQWGGQSLIQPCSQTTSGKTTMSFCSLRLRIFMATFVGLTFTGLGSLAVTVEDKIKGAFFGTLVSDSLCLGSHYEYDAPTIKKAYGGLIEEFMAPGEKLGGQTHGVGWGRRNYHPGQMKGGQTDYGLYNVLMLEYLASRKDPAKPVDLKELIPVWKRRINSDWGAWVCSMTRTTMQQIQEGVPYDALGGNSNAMSMRSAAAHAVWRDEASIEQAVRSFMFTHRNKEALGGALFFAKVAHRIIQKGLNPREAIDAVASESPGWLQRMVQTAISKYEEAIDTQRPLSKEEFVDDLAITSMARLWDVGKTEPIKVGKASPTEGTLPGSIYIILKYMDDFPAAVIANAMVGGDNASRGTNIGLVLGAYHGVQAIPEKFRLTLRQWEHSEEMLMKLPLLKSEPTEL